MKMLFSSPSGSEVGLLKGLLDEAGVACEIRNESTYSNLPAAPFQPEIWVVNDEDYTKACEVRNVCHRSLSPEAPQQSAAGCRWPRGNAVLCAFTGVLLLAAAALLALQFVQTGDWGRFTFDLVLFGLPGTALLWSGAARLLALPSKW